MQSRTSTRGCLSPDKHPLVLTCRKLALRTETFRRGRTRPALRGHIPALDPSGGFAPPPPPPGEPPPRDGGRAGPFPGTRSRKKAATAAHMAVLHDGVLSHDEARALSSWRKPARPCLPLP